MCFPIILDDVSMFSTDSDMLKSLPKLSRQELEVACEDFSNIIGSTPETVVYKGTMKDGPEVSVISLCAFEGHWTSHHELFYQNKVWYMTPRDSNTCFFFFPWILNGVMFSGHWSGKIESWEHSKVLRVLQGEWSILSDASLRGRTKWDVIWASTL